jgi:hypothetical protein
MTGADDPDSDTEVPICVRPEVVALACSRVRSMGEEVPHSTDSSERLSDNPSSCLPVPCVEEIGMMQDRFMCFWFAGSAVCCAREVRSPKMQDLSPSYLSVDTLYSSLFL